MPSTSKAESKLNDGRPGLGPPRFSLAALFVVVGVLGVLFATFSYVGSYATLLLILFTLTVGAHVAGNAIGTKLRDSARHSSITDDEEQSHRGPIHIATTDFAPASQLHYRSALGKPIFLTTVTGATMGAIVGGYGLATLMEHPTWPTIAIGAIASAVLGGIWTFAASSFLQVATSAMKQATRDPNR